MDPRSGLTANPKTHVVVTVSGTQHYITDKVNRILAMAGLNDMVELDDKTKVKVSMISSITPIREFYQQFPEKKPDPSRNNPDDAEYKRINDECLMAVKKYPTKTLAKVLTKLELRNQKKPDYTHYQLANACRVELTERGYLKKFQPSYSFEEISSLGFDGLINKSSADNTKALIRGMDKFLKANPQSPWASLLRTRMAEALNKKTNEQKNTTAKTR